MKASEFIKVALIDQMQQIADLGLWFHLAKLIPQGVELLARVKYLNDSDGYLLTEHNPESTSITDHFQTSDFYEEYFPKGYYEIGVHFASNNFFSGMKTRHWLTSMPEDAISHLQPYGEKVQWGAQPYYLHVPQWFEDFKTAAKDIYVMIMMGQLKDIEVLKTIDE